MADLASTVWRPGRHRDERRYDGLNDRWWRWTGDNWVSDPADEMGG